MDGIEEFSSDETDTGASQLSSEDKVLCVPATVVADDDTDDDEDEIVLPKSSGKKQKIESDSDTDNEEKITPVKSTRKRIFDSGNEDSGTDEYDLPESFEAKELFRKNVSADECNQSAKVSLSPTILQEENTGTPSSKVSRKRRSTSQAGSTNLQTTDEDNTDDEIDSADDGNTDSSQPRCSKKKKFRRIKRQQSSQELSVCNSGYSSDRNDDSTVIITSDEEHTDSSSSSEESADENSSSSSSSDGSGSDEENLDPELQDATQHPLFGPVSVAFQLIALQAAGEEEEILDLKEKGVLEQVDSLDKQVESKLNLCESQAWCAAAATAIHTYPNFVKVLDREELTGGDFMHLDNCEVCNREEHPWKYEVLFEGEPYDKKTLEQEESQQDELDELQLSFKMGCFCYARTKDYHELYHWKYHLYQTIKEKLNCAGLNTIQRKRQLVKIQENRQFLLETFLKLKAVMHRITQDYTLDGNSLRGNRKWQREYAALHDC